MDLDYLVPYRQRCELEKLNLLKSQRDSWAQRPSAKNYVDLMDALPRCEKVTVDLTGPSIVIGREDEISDEHLDQIMATARELIPWRKGPVELFGQKIDSEWRSDFKWDRIQSHLDPLQGKLVLDIGCNNGYFLFKMASQNPRMVLGFDPVLHYYIQFAFLNHFAKVPNLHFELLGGEHLEHFENLFDVILCMGVIYHRRHPIQQLTDIRKALRKGGQLILETLTTPGGESYALFPEDRYAGMRNVWFVPTVSCLINWAHRAKFNKIEIVSQAEITGKEQRLTPWCPPPRHSLGHFLDPNDKTKTVEGYPAPQRVCLSLHR